MKKTYKENIISYTLIAPAGLVMILFIFRPMFNSLVLSLQEYRLGFNIKEFIWFENYKNLFQSSEFWGSIGKTTIFSASLVIISLLLGLLLALLIKDRKKAGSFLQIVYFLPVTATMAAMAIVWKFILDNNFGILNTFLETINYPSVDWLRNPDTAMGVVIFLSVWSNAGYAMVFFLAGLSNIPASLYQAAALDGSNKIQDFRYITWPLLSPTTLFMIIIMTKRALSSFDTIKVMTNGGPVGATEVLSFLLYKEAFQYFNIGYASAIAIIFFFLILLLAIFQMKSDRRVFYQ